MFENKNLIEKVLEEQMSGQELMSEQVGWSRETPFIQERQVRSRKF